jgi:hypothetical protein
MNLFKSFFIIPVISTAEIKGNKISKDSLKKRNWMLPKNNETIKFNNSRNV